MSREEKAEEMFQAAHKLATKFNWFGIVKQQNQEDAAELFAKAAAQFKICKNYKRSGESFEHAAGCSLAAQSELEAMGYFKDAGKCYRNVDVECAINCYRQSIDFYMSADRFTQAAKLYEELGDMLSEDNRLQEAIHEYEESANCFQTENDITGMDKRLLIVASLNAKIGEFDRSIEIFEKVALHSIDSNLLRWSAKNYLMKSALCHICRGIKKRNFSEAHGALEKYKDMTDLFSSSRECRFCEQLVDALINCDEESYQRAYIDFNSISPVPDWETDLIHQGQLYLKKEKVAAPILDAPVDLNNSINANLNSYDEPPVNNNNNNNPFDAPQLTGDAPQL